MVVYRGHQLLRHFSGSERQNMVFRYDGPALNVNCDLDLICERDVAGKVDAGKDITVNGNILHGGADAGKDVIIHGDVTQGNVDAGKDCEIGGNVGGRVSAGKNITVAGSVGQSATAGVMVKSGSVSGRMISGVASMVGKKKTEKQLRSVRHAFFWGPHCRTNILKYKKRGEGRRMIRLPLLLRT